MNFLRDVITDEPIVMLPAAHRLPDAASLGEPTATTGYDIDADQTYRYAEASGDHSIYHLDEAAARAAGFDGIIVHGLCTMAFASRAVVAAPCGGDLARLRRLAVRFSRPMYPGHAMATSWAPAAAADRPAPFRFQVADDSGVTVITDGLAAVGPYGWRGHEPTCRPRCDRHRRRPRAGPIPGALSGGPRRRGGGQRPRWGRARPRRRPDPATCPWSHAIRADGGQAVASGHDVADWEQAAEMVQLAVRVR